MDSGDRGEIGWLAIAAVACFVVLHGYQTIDVVEFRTISAAPLSVNLDRDRQFLYQSPLTFLLGAYYQHHGIDDATAFVAVHAIGMGLFVLASTVAFQRTFAGAERGIAAIAFFSSPVLAVLLSWVGKSDPFLLAFSFLLTVSTSRLTRTLLCMLMIACHRELALLLIVGHGLLEDGDLVSLAAGAIMGVAASLAYTHGLMTSPPQSRIDFAAVRLPLLSATFMASPLLHVWASLGPFWFYVLRRNVFDRSRVVYFFLSFVAAACSLDFTRVFAIASVPLVFSISRDVAAEWRQHDVHAWGIRVPTAALVALVFCQVQLAGTTVVWSRWVQYLSVRP